MGAVCRHLGCALSLVDRCLQTEIGSVGCRALLLPLTKVLVDSFEMQPARERFMKHYARVRRYKHRDHLLFWTSFHVPGRAKSAPSGQRSCSSTKVHWQPSHAGISTT